MRGTKEFVDIRIYVAPRRHEDSGKMRYPEIPMPPTRTGKISRGNFEKIMLTPHGDGGDRDGGPPHE